MSDFVFVSCICVSDYHILDLISDKYGKSHATVRLEYMVSSIRLKMRDGFCGLLHGKGEKSVFTRVNVLFCS